MFLTFIHYIISFFSKMPFTAFIKETVNDHYNVTTIFQAFTR